MNKKLILLLVLLAVVVAALLIPTPPPAVSPQLSAYYEKFTETAAAPTQPSFVWVDASGSMKGYFNTPQGMPNHFVDALTKLAFYPKNTNAEVYFVGSNHKFDGMIANIIGNLRIFPDAVMSEFDAQIDSLMKLPNGQLGVLVTDGIIYVGRNTATALEEVKQKIAATVKPNKAVAVLKYEGDFNTDGSRRIWYYDKLNTRIDGLTIPNRPFYAIIVGSKENIRLVKADAKDVLAAKDALYFGLHDEASHKNGQTFAKGYDDTNPDMLDPNETTVTLNVPLPECVTGLQQDFYQQNIKVLLGGQEIEPSVYTVQLLDGNTLNVIIDKNKLTMSAKSPKFMGGVQTLNVQIANPMPQQWVMLNCDDDAQIAQFPVMQTQTFGLLTLLEGLRQGFGEDNKLLFDITLKCQN